MSKYAYPAIFTPEENGTYSIVFPDLDGCYTCGDSLEDGLEMAEDVLALVLYNYEKEKRPMPTPSKHTDLKLNENEFINYVVCDTMLTVKSMDVRNNFKSLCDKVFNGETLIISRPKNENIVMLLECGYNEIIKSKRNVEYLAMLDKSMAEAEAGGFITTTISELEAYE